MRGVVLGFMDSVPGEGVGWASQEAPMAASVVGLVSWGLGAWVAVGEGLSVAGRALQGWATGCSRWGPVQLGGGCILLESVPDMENRKCLGRPPSRVRAALALGLHGWVDAWLLAHTVGSAPELPVQLVGP